MNDPRGNPASTSSAPAIDATEQALWRMMSFYGTPLDDLDAAAQADPAWPLPLLMKAGFLLSLTEPPLVVDAIPLLNQAEVLAAHANGPGNHRERQHLHALCLLSNGDWHGACNEWEALLLNHPRDALALQWAHLFDFYRGDAGNLRQRVARVLPEWDDTDPLHPYVLGLHAFGLEECNRYDEAEAAGRRALGGTAKVPWAIHAVAHVMEMQGRFDEGFAWMARWWPDWAQGNGFSGHLGWHHALFALESLNHAQALALFDEHLHADPAHITLQRLDAAALLWRLHLLGVDVGPRWQQLLHGWDPQPASAGHYAFNDLHALLALIGAQDLRRARAWLHAVTQRAEAAGGSNREMSQHVGVPLMQGLLAFAEGRYAAAIEAMYPVRAEAQRFGGSHAQRDLITQTLLGAAAAAPDAAVGRALLNERRLAKPATPLTQYWAGRLGTTLR
jgi:tetratricopeptide (TPR) repeat protein